MENACPASEGAIKAIAKDLEKSTPDLSSLQSLFVATMDGGTALPKNQRDDCLRLLVTQNANDQRQNSVALTESLGLNAVAPHNAHDWQRAGQLIEPADVLPVFQLMVGNDSQLTTIRPNLSANETRNGVRQSVFSEHIDQQHKRVLQFGANSVIVEK